MNTKAIVAQNLPRGKPLEATRKVWACGCAFDHRARRTEPCEAHAVEERTYHLRRGNYRKTAVDTAFEATLDAQARVMDVEDAVGVFPLTTQIRTLLRQLARLLEPQRGEPWLAGGVA